MDVTFTEEQHEIIGLADRILRDRCGPEELRAREREGHGSWPRQAWARLAETGLLGIGLPTRVGGGGYGLVEAALVVEAVARAAAPLPAYATLVLGAAPIARFGSPDQQDRWLPGVVDGSRLLTGALVGPDDTDAPVRSAPREGGAHTLNGEAWYVPFATDADAIVVPVTTDRSGPLLAVVPTETPGLTTEPLAPMSGEPSAVVRFDGVEIDDGDILAGPDRSGTTVQPTTWLRDRAVAATCVAQVGTCAGALALTASYVSTREQFGVKLATLQAVSQRAADAWIDTELVRLTAWRATWRLAEELEADEELAVAKHFTAEAGQRVVAAAQHLHGGIGMDLDHPVHRYFRWAKEHEQRLGGGSEHLARLGQSLAAR